MTPSELSKAKLQLRENWIRNWQIGCVKPCGTLIVYLNSYGRKNTESGPCLIRRPIGEPKYLLSKGVRPSVNIFWAPPADTPELVVTEGVFDALAVRHFMGVNAVACLTNRVSPQQAEEIAKYHNGIVHLGLDSDEPGCTGAVESYGALVAAGCTMGRWIVWPAKDAEEAYLLGQTPMQKSCDSLLYRYATCAMLYKIALKTRREEDLSRWYNRAKLEGR